MDSRGTERRFDSGDRVTLTGTVAYERSGFVFVRWDGGSESLVWGAELVREPLEEAA
jgi:hypothetical protein